MEEELEVQETEETEESVDFTDTDETEEVEKEETETEESEEVEEKMVSLKEAERLADEKAKKLAEEKANQSFAKRLEREKKKWEKEHSPYKKTEEILKAGLGSKDINDANNKLMEFYKEQGVDIPDSKQGLSNREIEILAKAEADEIMELGIEDMTSEASALANKGYENLDAREKVIFTTLADKLTRENQKSELKKIGVEPKVLDDKDFKEFSKKFNVGVSIADIYKLYNKSTQQKDVEKIGSMKSESNPKKVKEYYTYEESLQFTKKDLDKNPDLFKAIEKSMSKW